MILVAWIRSYKNKLKTVLENRTSRGFAWPTQQCRSREVNSSKNWTRYTGLKLILLLKPIITILNIYLCSLLPVYKFFVNFPVLGRSWMQSRMRWRKKMLTLLNRIYVFAIKNTGQYTTEEKLKQMWVLEPQAFEFAQKCYFKHSICWSTVFLWNNAFLASLKGFNMLQGYPERRKQGLTYQSVRRGPDSLCLREAQGLVLIALNTTNLQFPSFSEDWGLLLIKLLSKGQRDTPYTESSNRVAH